MKAATIPALLSSRNKMIVRNMAPSSTLLAAFKLSQEFKFRQKRGVRELGGGKEGCSKLKLLPVSVTTFTFHE